MTQGSNFPSEEGGGATPLPNTFSISKGEFTKLKAELEEAIEEFWKRDQICGFDKNGNRIGTGIPRVKPSYFSNNEYSL